MSYSEVLYDLFITRVRCMQLSILKQPAQQEGGECCCAQPRPAVHDACCALSPCFARCLIDSAVHRMPCFAQCLTYFAVHHALLSSIVAVSGAGRQTASAADTLPQPMSLASKFRCSCCQAPLLCCQVDKLWGTRLNLKVRTFCREVQHLTLWKVHQAIAFKLRGLLKHFRWVGPTHVR